MFNVNEFSHGLVKLLRQKMRERDMTGREIAAIAGCNDGEISHIKRKGHIPRREMLRAIGQALGCEDEMLMAGGYIPRPNWEPAKEADKIVKARLRDFSKRLKRTKLEILSELKRTKLEILSELEAACG